MWISDDETKRLLRDVLTCKRLRGLRYIILMDNYERIILQYNAAAPEGFATKQSKDNLKGIIEKYG